ncbi:hypothetical protein [Tsukamurella strandjordii]|uniref:Lipoprotein n=1 Tax=Tsukamurella strandjordii TaxID=147577 RepID=A0AA90NIV6_9ACTN|nr:hypothetical protein [Tsukamurella strandjordii]MDP0399838.1 hypothetical protein [Tsukamurella strandjordii]
MRLTVRAAGVVATAMMAGSVLSCGSPSPAPQAEPTVVRKDKEPISKRIKNIGENYVVRWVSGSFTNERIPGPNSYWLDASITLRDDEVASGLRAAAGSPVGHETPDVPAEINRSGDPGITSAGLNAFVAVEPGTVRAYLYPERGVLVVKYLGGN